MVEAQAHPSVDRSKAGYEPIFIGRQPIFDREREIRAYELLFRRSLRENRALVEDANEATARVIVDGYSIAAAALPPDRKVFINFPQQLLLDMAPLALPKDGCVVEILEDVEPTPSLLRACRNLKQAGYSLALDDYVGQPELEPLLELADIVKVDVAGREPKDIIKLTMRLRREERRFLAEKVENRKMFEMCYALGYDMFQGYYFSRPEIVSGRKILIGDSARFRLLSELADESYDVKRIASVISHDTGLSHRLLRYLNTAQFSFGKKVNTIAQAVTLMGVQPLKQWLMALMLSDINRRGRAEELTYQSVQRARFLELLHECLKQPELSGETMFLLGLFSNLDALLGQPMEEVVSLLPLSEIVNAALRGMPCDALSWIELARAMEVGAWEDVRGVLDMHSLSHKEAALCHAKAAAWAHTVLKEAWSR